MYVRNYKTFFQDLGEIRLIEEQFFLGFTSMMEESTWRVMATDHRHTLYKPLEPQKQRQGWPIEQLMQDKFKSYNCTKDLEGGFISCPSWFAFVYVSTMWTKFYPCLDLWLHYCHSTSNSEAFFSCLQRLSHYSSSLLNSRQLQGAWNQLCSKRSHSEGPHTFS